MAAASELVAVAARTVLTKYQVRRGGGGGGGGQLPGAPNRRARKPRSPPPPATAPTLPPSQGKDVLELASPDDLRLYNQHFDRLPGAEAGDVAMDDVLAYFDGQMLRVRGGWVGGRPGWRVRQAPASRVVTGPMRAAHASQACRAVPCCGWRTNDTRLIPPTCCLLLPPPPPARAGGGADPHPGPRAGHCRQPPALVDAPRVPGGLSPGLRHAAHGAGERGVGEGECAGGCGGVRAAGSVARVQHHPPRGRAAAAPCF